jgi:hypothetical protein
MAFIFPLPLPLIRFLLRNHSGMLKRGCPRLFVKASQRATNSSRLRSRSITSAANS